MDRPAKTCSGGLSTGARSGIDPDWTRAYRPLSDSAAAAESIFRPRRGGEGRTLTDEPIGPRLGHVDGPSRPRRRRALPLAIDIFSHQRP